MEWGKTSQLLKQSPLKPPTFVKVASTSPEYMDQNKEVFTINSVWFVSQKHVDRKLLLKSDDRHYISVPLNANLTFKQKFTHDVGPSIILKDLLKNPPTNNEMRITLNLSRNTQACHPQKNNIKLSLDNLNVIGIYEETCYMMHAYKNNDQLDIKSVCISSKCPTSFFASMGLLEKNDEEFVKFKTNYVNELKSKPPISIVYEIVLLAKPPKNLHDVASIDHSTSLYIVEQDSEENIEKEVPSINRILNKLAKESHQQRIALATEKRKTMEPKTSNENVYHKDPTNMRLVEEKVATPSVEKTISVKDDAKNKLEEKSKTLGKSFCKTGMNDNNVTTIVEAPKKNSLVLKQVPAVGLGKKKNESKSVYENESQNSKDKQNKPTMEKVSEVYEIEFESPKIKNQKNGQLYQNDSDKPGAHKITATENKKPKPKEEPKVAIKTDNDDLYDVVGDGEDYEEIDGGPISNSNEKKNRVTINSNDSNYEMDLDAEKKSAKNQKTPPEVPSIDYEVYDSVDPCLSDAFEERRSLPLPELPKTPQRKSSLFDKFKQLKSIASKKMTLNNSSFYTSSTKRWKNIQDIPKNLDISKLTISEVDECLSHLKLDKYRKQFQKNQVDGLFLSGLGEDALIQKFKMDAVEAKKLVMFGREQWRPM